MNDMSQTPNIDEQTYWSGPQGKLWIEWQADLEAVCASVSELTLDMASIDPGDSVLDIGCGTGGHTLLAADRVAPTGVVYGVDIAEPLIEAAQSRAAGKQGVFFGTADAQTADLGEARYDVATSRFGVMFFDDPVAAFRNIGKSVKPGGRMVFAVWGPMANNPWWSLPVKFSKAQLGWEPGDAPSAPGPLAMSDAQHALSLLEAAGFERAEVIPMAVPLTHPDGARGAAHLSVNVGAAARALRMTEADESQKQALEDKLAESFAFYETPGGLSIPASLNILSVDKR